MTAKAGDTVFSVESITFTPDGRCSVRLAVEVVGATARHRIATRGMEVVPTNDQRSRLGAFYAEVSAAIAANPPAGLECTLAPPLTLTEREEARRTALEADRARRGLAEEPPSEAPPPTNNRPA
jgi:hypothetical protein